MAYKLAHICCLVAWSWSVSWMLSMFEFDYDSGKAKKNIRKHGVSFSECCSVFEDLNAIELFDFDHSDDEDRFILIGMSNRGRVLAVPYTMRENTYRIISGRVLSKDEVKKYGY